jgi:hypothetical protein
MNHIYRFPVYIILFSGVGRKRLIEVSLYLGICLKELSRTTMTLVPAEIRLNTCVQRHPVQDASV